MKKHTLKATKRTIVGKKSASLRKAGKIPATVYGKGVDAVSIELLKEKTLPVLHEAGETGLIELSVDESVRPVLVKQVSRHPVTGDIVHIEFQQVNLKEKIKANVPVVLTGESQAVKENLGTLLHLVDEIEVEALPTDLPEHFEIDITPLAAVNDQIIVENLSIPEKVTLLTDKDIIIVKIGQLTAPEPEPEPVVEEAVEGATATETPTEGGEPEKSEAPAEEK